MFQNRSALILALTTFIFIVVYLASEAIAQHEQEGSGAYRPPTYGTGAYGRNVSYHRYLHLRDHPPLVTERYGRPFTHKTWNCDLRVHQCNLTNRVSYAPFRRESNFNGAPQALVLDVGTAVRALHGLDGRPKPFHAHNAARLTTGSRYFPARYTDACLVFSYFWNGAGRKTMKLLQRSEETICIFADEIGSPQAYEVFADGQWRDVQLQLNLTYGNAQFVIEFQYDAPQSIPADRSTGRPNDFSRLGSIAIRDFSIGYGYCQRSDAYECDAPDFERNRAINPIDAQSGNGGAPLEPGRTNFVQSGSRRYTTAQQPQTTAQLFGA